MFDSVERYLHHLESHPSWPSGPRESGDAPGYYRRRPRLAAPYGKVKVEKIWDENRFLTLTLPFHCMIWTWYESFWVWYNVFYNYFILGRSSNYQLALESGASWMIYGWFPRHPYDIRDIRMIYMDDISMIYGWYMDAFWTTYGWSMDDIFYRWYTDDTRMVLIYDINSLCFCVPGLLAGSEAEDWNPRSWTQPLRTVWGTGGYSCATVDVSGWLWCLYV